MKLYTTTFLFIAVVMLAACGSEDDHATEHKIVPHQEKHEGSHAAESNEHEHSAVDENAIKAAGFINTKCPIMGDPVDPKFSTLHNGKKVGFCCDDCLPKWVALSESEKSEKLRN